METYENGQDEKQKNVTVIRVSLRPHKNAWRLKLCLLLAFFKFCSYGTGYKQGIGQYECV